MFVVPYRSCSVPLWDPCNMWHDIVSSDPREYHAALSHDFLTGVRIFFGSQEVETPSYAIKPTLWLYYICLAVLAGGPRRVYTDKTCYIKTAPPQLSKAMLLALPMTDSCDTCRPYLRFKAPYPLRVFVMFPSGHDPPPWLVAGFDNMGGANEGETFCVGETVAWTSADKDIPSGTRGAVLGYSDSGNVRVKFPNGTWCFPERKLYFPLAMEYQTGDNVGWIGSDSDIPAGSIGEVLGYIAGLDIVCTKNCFLHTETPASFMYEISARTLLI